MTLGTVADILRKKLPALVRQAAFYKLQVDHLAAGMAFLAASACV